MFWFFFCYLFSLIFRIFCLKSYKRVAPSFLFTISRNIFTFLFLYLFQQHRSFSVSFFFQGTRFPYRRCRCTWTAVFLLFFRSKDRFTIVIWFYLVSRSANKAEITSVNLGILQFYYYASSTPKSQSLSVLPIGQVSDHVVSLASWTSAYLANIVL